MLRNMARHGTPREANSIKGFQPRQDTGRNSKTQGQPCLKPECADGTVTGTGTKKKSYLVRQEREGLVRQAGGLFGDPHA